MKTFVVSINLNGTPCDMCGPLAQGVAGIFHGATQQQERVFIMQRKALPLALLVLSKVLNWLGWRNLDCLVVQGMITGGYSARLNLTHLHKEVWQCGVVMKY